MRVLVTGGLGLVGSHLVPLLQEAGHDVVVADLADGADATLDIADEDDVEALVGDVAPDHVVNLAAYTAVDDCETHEDDAMVVNGVGAGNVARACERHGAFLTHVSTDYVFDGEKDTPYRPDDPVGPQSVYARTKLAGENEVTDALSSDRFQIVRCQNIYGETGPSFPRAILDRVRDGKPVFGVVDQVLTPTYAGDVAAGLAACVDMGPGAPGVLLLSSRGACTRYVYVKRILAFAGYADTPVDAWTHAQVESTYPQLASRPRRAVFDPDDFAQRTGYRAPHWETALRAFLDREDSE